MVTSGNEAYLGRVMNTQLRKPRATAIQPGTLSTQADVYGANRHSIGRYGFCRDPPQPVAWMPAGSGFLTPQAASANEMIVLEFRSSPVPTV